MARSYSIASMLAALAMAMAFGADAGNQAADPPVARASHGEGIWKAVVPAAPMKGEFDDFDPVGIAAGAQIKADCSLNWVNPDDGARYCFSSGTSLEYFLDRPHYNIERARAGWRKLNEQH